MTNLWSYWSQSQIQFFLPKLCPFPPIFSLTFFFFLCVLFVRRVSLSALVDVLIWLCCSGSGGASDPVVSVTCFGKKQSTNTIKNNLNPYFDETLFFEKRMVHGEMATSKCVVSVYDANAIKRNVMIGNLSTRLVPH
eukprot:TRINITY_DN1201_c0_g1_i1.p2 TRINITY_DN1201_c0_g1~~TRINITY_DN1201_c0_g1_i1.p2  ORF type:complete len:137 (+),score=26.34 TRINITY_DN1201_c0_g1_i1:696-1106(+)